MKRHCMGGIGIALLLAGVYGHVFAQATSTGSGQAYPVRPVRLIVPFPAGGGNDTMTRTVGQKLAERWGQQVVVDNRAGAGGNIGSEIAARATPDGYTLLSGSSQLAVNPSLHAKLPFDAARDFAPIALVASSVYVLSVHPAVAATSVKDLIALAKAKPGQLNYASGGAGSPLHMSAELFKMLTGAQMVHVPYKGGVPAVAAVLSGETQVIFGSTATVIPHIRSNRLRALGVTSTKRSRLVPEVPTIAESGVAGYELVNWYGVLAPARTPKAIVDKVSADLAAVMQLPDVIERLTAQGVEPMTSTSAEFAAYIKSELVKWATLIKSAGIKAE